MDQASLVALVSLLGTAALLLAGLVVMVVVRRDRRRLEDELGRSREDLAALKQRLDSLTKQVAPPRVVAEREYLITNLEDGADALERRAAQDAEVTDISAGAFVSLAVGESMVRLVSLGHGLRRALSPENRNRIAFEMRQEVRRSRKQRRREIKEARRHLRAAERADITGDAA